jgi:hypothetical protein
MRVNIPFSPSERATTAPTAALSASISSADSSGA